ncbi:hypothetical protein MK079_01105 [Candidatus Gracilibacteria bacterium]|nr:hypothetical protein [Candidatus Gracilibacteria bacterium]
MSQSTIADTQKKVDPMNVKNIEELIYLLKEGDQDYRNNGGIPAEEAYFKGLERIHNLGK